MLIVADDLSGAAECAGVGWRRGLDAELRTDLPAEPQAGFAVLDTDSRLLPAAEAAARVRTVMAGCARKPDSLFKKTDSVLRGPVRAELEAMLGALGCDRCLLVPANPPQGRTVEQGRLLVRGFPLDQTEFARDPHHPAHSADVRELLGQSAAFPVSSLAFGDPWPDKGICVGDARTEEELREWAARASADGMPVAGSAAFLSALLAHLGHRERPYEPTPRGPRPPRTLICSGSASAASRDRIRLAEAAGTPVIRLPADTYCRGVAVSATGYIATAVSAVELARARSALAHSATTIICIGAPVCEDPGAPARLLEALTGLAAQLLTTHRMDRLLIEGGATAARLLRRLAANRFRVVREWAPGVVALAATDGRGPEITIKPGSYPWLGPFAEAISEDRGTLA